MGEKALKIDDVEREVSALLNEALTSRGWTASQLARESGVNRSRVYTMLRNESPIGVSTLSDMCAALGLRASEVIREAEAVVAARARAEERERLLADLAAGVPVESLGLAAKQDTSRAREAAERTGWRNDVGEEPQDSPDWEE